MTVSVDLVGVQAVAAGMRLHGVKALSAHHRHRITEAVPSAARYRLVDEVHDPATPMWIAADDVTAISPSLPPRQN